MLTELQFESRSPFLPAFRIPVNKTFFTEGGYNSINELKDLVLNKEQEILEENDPYPKSDSVDWLTNRLYGYTIFKYAEEYPVLLKLKEHIKKSYLEYCANMKIKPEKVYLTGWANILRKNGRNITPHHHADGHIHAPFDYAYVSCHISITASGTSTYYENPFIKNQACKIINVPGEVYMFPSWVVHWTDINQDDEPRISIAFDIVTEEVYNMFPETNKNFIEL